MVLILLTALFASGFLASAYPTFARHRGWRISKHFANEMRPIPLLGLGTIVVVPVLAGFAGAWWHGLVVAAVGFFACLLLINYFRQASQLLSAIWMILFWVLTGILVVPSVL